MLTGCRQAAGHKSEGCRDNSIVLAVVLCLWTAPLNETSEAPWCGQTSPANFALRDRGTAWHLPQQQVFGLRTQNQATRWPEPSPPPTTHFLLPGLTRADCTRSSRAVRAEKRGSQASRASSADLDTSVQRATPEGRVDTLPEKFGKTSSRKNTSLPGSFCERRKQRGWHRVRIASPT